MNNFEYTDMKQTIPEFYAGQRILLTGGTGFMGKVLVEKLLRCCPDVERLYLLVRSKKGKSMEERWKLVTDLPLFDKLKSLRPESLEKVSLISGDISKEGLGLNLNDKLELQENVTIIFHAAADVQFTENIITALVDNVKATKSILDLAVTIHNLKVFVHISTAFSNFNLPPSESVEKIFPSFHDWRVLLKLQETEANVLLLLKQKLLYGHPNPYTWSKSLAEQVVKDYSEHFPTVVIRPSIVIATIREDPLVGWIDSLNALSAVGVAHFLGILHVAQTSPDYFCDVIPLDIATRALITSAKKAVETNDRVAVYNCATTKVNHFTFNTMRIKIKELRDIYPVKNIVWAGDVSCVMNRLLHSICFLLWQVLPFLFLDTILKLTGNKTMFLKIAKKLANGNNTLSKFMNTNDEFPIDNYETLEGYLDNKDKAEFSMDVSDFINHEADIITSQIVGILKYVLKEDLCKEALNQNRKHLRRLKIVKKAFDWIQYLAIGWLSWCFMKPLISEHLKFISN